MKKDITVDFYKIVVQAKKTVPFIDLLNAIARIPDDQTRNKTINRCPVRMKKVVPWEDCRLGEMVRLRVTEAAIKGNERGKLARISMDEDEYLSGLTAFLFHPRSQILCLERNHTGVGPGSFANYFSSMGNLDGALELRVIIEPEALKRMTAMTQYRALEVRLATFENMTEFAKDVPSVANAVSLAKFFHAPFIDFKISMGHNKGSLTRDVVNAVKELLQKRDENPAEITKIRVLGRDPGADTAEPIDLIANRVTHEDSIRLSHDPDESFDDRVQVLKRAWGENRGKIKALANAAI